MQQTLDQADTYDICIIGGGPAGLSVLSALHSPDGVLTEAQKKRSGWNSRYQKGAGARKPLSICVVDPSGSWLSAWKGRFESLGIKFLRSPAWATPDYFSDAAITEFAWKHDRLGELHDAELPKTATRYLKGVVDGGLFKLPGTKLFNDFCDDLAKSLPHTFITGMAQGVEKEGGAYRVDISGRARSLICQHVVFALGAANTPNIPKTLSCIYENSVDETNPRLVHTFSWRQVLSLPIVDETVVVIGGGLSAAQTALLASRRGAKKVVLASRRKMHSRLYDLSVDWLDPKVGWDSDKGEKSRMFEFYDTPKAERRAWVKSARGGATVPPSYLEALEEKVRAGKFECIVDTITHAECGDDGRILLSFLHSTEPIIADRVILATGSTIGVRNIPLLEDSISRFNLPVIDNLPDINEQLQWGDEKFSVVGNLALLQVGPDSGNLSGCRRCAERCANYFGAFERYVETGGPLSNTYGSLFESDSDDCSSEDDCEEIVDEAESEEAK